MTPTTTERSLRDHYHPAGSRWVTRGIWAAGLAVACAAAVATAHGLYEVAASAGAPAFIAGLYPLITDGLALVAYSATTRLAGHSRRYAWTIVILAAGLSGLAQAVYLAQAVHTAPAWLRAGIGAWPALAAAIVAHLLYLLATAGRTVAVQVGERGGVRPYDGTVRLPAGLDRTDRTDEMDGHTARTADGPTANLRTGGSGAVRPAGQPPSMDRRLYTVPYNPASPPTEENGPADVEAAAGTGTQAPEAASNGHQNGSQHPPGARGAGGGPASLQGASPASEVSAPDSAGSVRLDGDRTGDWTVPGQLAFNGSYEAGTVRDGASSRPADCTQIRPTPSAVRGAPVQPGELYNPLYSAVRPTGPDAVQPAPAQHGAVHPPVHLDGVRPDGEPACVQPTPAPVQDPESAGQTGPVSARDRAHDIARAHVDRHGELPTVSELAEQAEVARGTAGTVLKQLRADKPDQRHTSTSGRDGDR